MNLDTPSSFTFYLNQLNTTFSSKLIRESWADFIEHYFIIAYYPSEANRDDTPKIWTDHFPTVRT